MFKGFCKGEGRANMLRAINRVHTGWPYINEHIYHVHKNILS